jgi:hypothetical protein
VTMIAIASGHNTMTTKVLLYICIDRTGSVANKFRRIPSGRCCRRSTTYG